MQFLVHVILPRRGQRFYVSSDVWNTTSGSGTRGGLLLMLLPQSADDCGPCLEAVADGSQVGAVQHAAG